MRSILVLRQPSRPRKQLPYQLWWLLATCYSWECRSKEKNQDFPDSKQKLNSEVLVIAHSSALLRYRYEPFAVPARKRAWFCHISLQFLLILPGLAHAALPWGVFKVKVLTPLKCECRPFGRNGVSPQMPRFSAPWGSLGIQA